MKIIVHIANERPIVCEVDEMPRPSDNVLIAHRPRRRDGSLLNYLNESTETVIFPWHRVELVQILPASETEEVISIVRE